MKRIAAITAVIAATAIGLVALWQMGDTVVLLLLGIAIAAAFEPLIRSIAARRAGRNLAIAIVYLSFTAAVILSLAAIVALVGSEINMVLEQLPLWYDGWLRSIAQRDDFGNLNSSLPDSTVLAGILADQGIGQIGSLAFTAILRVVGVSAVIIGAAALSFFWLQSNQDITQSLIAVVPPRFRAPTREIARRIYSEVGYYLRGEIIRISSVFLCLLSVCTLLGLPGATLLAGVGGIAMIVPIIGPGLAIIPAIVVGFAHNEQLGWMTLGSTALIMAALNWLFGHRRGGPGSLVTLQPLLVVVLIWVLVDLGGPLLALLATPAAAVIQVVAQFIRDERISAGPTGDWAEQASVAELCSRTQLLSDAVERDEQSPEVRQIVQQARALIAEAEQAVRVEA